MFIVLTPAYADVFGNEERFSTDLNDENFMDWVSEHPWTPVILLIIYFFLLMCSWDNKRAFGIGHGTEGTHVCDC